MKKSNSDSGLTTQWSNRLRAAGLTVLTVLMLCITACNTPQPIYNRGLPKEYNLCYQEIYGHCYDSIPYAVVALDLYSDGLTLNEQHRMTGSGYNLYLSDIIVPDSLLAEGSYISNTSAQPFTFLPGHDYEGTPHGIYILRVEDSKIASIQVVDSGSFTFSGDTLDFTLYFRNSYGSQAKYQPRFIGTLIPWIKK